MLVWASWGGAVASSSTTTVSVISGKGAHVVHINRMFGSADTLESEGRTCGGSCGHGPPKGGPCGAGQLADRWSRVNDAPDILFPWTPPASEAVKGAGDCGCSMPCRATDGGCSCSVATWVGFGADAITGDPAARAGAPMSRVPAKSPPTTAGMSPILFAPAHPRALLGQIFPVVRRAYEPPPPPTADYEGTTDAGCECAVTEEFLKSLGKAEGGCPGGITYRVEAEGDGCRRYICCRGECYSSGYVECDEPVIQHPELLTDPWPICIVCDQYGESDNSFECTVQLLAWPIYNFVPWGMFGGPFIWGYHHAIRFLDWEGNSTTYSAGPNTKSPCNSPATYGNWRYPYLWVDISYGVTFPENMVVVWEERSADLCKDTNDCLEYAAELIMLTCVEYSLFIGPNSNTAARYLLESCGLRSDQYMSPSQGWNWVEQSGDPFPMHYGTWDA